MPKTVLIVMFVVIVGACAGADDPVPTGRVSGQVLAGPTCPVQSADAPVCPPAPVTGTVRALDGDTVRSSMTLDQEGFYFLDLPAGEYTLLVDIGDQLFPVCEPAQVIVVDGFDDVADIACDTGIR